MSLDISPVRNLVLLDGADMMLVSSDDHSAHLRLVVDCATCADCIMPRGVLEEISTKLLGLPVRIDDLREN